VLISSYEAWTKIHDTSTIRYRHVDTVNFQKLGCGTTWIWQKLYVYICFFVYPYR